ncbi:MAG: deoxyribonuclease [Pseudomonadota bacterium]
MIFSPEEELELPATQQRQEVEQIVRLQKEETGQTADQGRPSADDNRRSSEMPVKPEVSPPATVVEHPQPPGEHDRQADVSDSGDSARRLIKQIRQDEKSLTLEQLFSQAVQFAQLGQETDAYLLHFYAARQGHGLSAFALASMHDPAHFSGANDLLDTADPVQAHKWYSVAAASQVAGAEERLQTLRGTVEAAAAAGDPGAQRLLLNWK